MGSKSTQTATAVKEVPQYVEDAQTNLLDTTNKITSPYLQTSPETTVAPLTSDQLYGSYLARNKATDEYTGKPIEYYPVTQQAQYSTAAQSGDPALMPATSAGYAATTPASNAGYAATTDTGAGQVGGSEINALLNPYRKDVLNPTLAAMRREYGKTRAEIAARSAASAGFGGSRGALEMAETNRAFGDEVAKTTAELMYKGYDQATATALANAGRGQEAGIFNAGQTNEMAQYNAGLAQDAGKFNAGQTNSMAQYNAGLADKANSTNQAAINAIMEANTNREQATGAANAAAENNMRQFNVGALQSGAQTQNTLANDEATRQGNALAQLLGVGNMQQATNQKELDQVTNMLKLLMQATPSGTGSTTTTTQPDNSPSTFQTLAGAAATILPLFFSDRRDKTDIKKLGTDAETGLDIFAYRYKGDPKNTPKVVGPMAQDIEKRYPGAVREIGGHKVVDGSMMSRFFAPAS